MIDRIKTVIARYLDIDPDTIDPNQSLEAYGADSLTRMDIVMTLEDEFNRELPDTVADAVTINDIAKLMNE